MRWLQGRVEDVQQARERLDEYKQQLRAQKQAAAGPKHSKQLSQEEWEQLQAKWDFQELEQVRPTPSPLHMLRHSETNHSA